MAVSPRDAPTPPDARTASRGDGLEISTLVITALASAGAALVSSELLGSGTLISAALTPVVIALLKEALDRQRRVVSEVVPVVVRPPRRRRRAPGEPRGAGTEEQPVPRQAEVGEVRVYRSTGRRWRLAAVTGLLGFVLAAAVLTVTELAAGGAVAGGSRSTTYFGGSDRPERPEREEEGAPAQDPTRSEPPATPDPSTSAPETPTVPEAETQDVPPATSTAPAPTTPADPAQPAPAPGTPAPAPEASPGTPAPPAP